MRLSQRHLRPAGARTFFRHPTQAVVAAFGAAVALGTVLLMLPAARAGDGSASFLEAFFTATSAVCVTGLTVVDTESYWSSFGEGVVLALIQVGGFGLMTFASLLAMLVWRRLGLRSRLTAAAETKAVDLGDVRTVVLGVVTISVLFESLAAAALTLRFALGYGEPWGQATYLGVFHAVSAFNNAGFALWSDSLVRFAGDPWICLPIALAVIAGGLGFPVWLELSRHLRQPRRWSMHTRMTLGASAVLLGLGTLFVTANEWTNPGTLGTMSAPDRLLAGFFQAVMPRTAGFNSVDYGEMREATLLGTEMLMFIGGGSASTAGGIKVTTFVLLLFVIWAEVRGERDVEAYERRVADRTIRQALTVALLGIGLVAVSTLALLEMTGLRLGVVLFETVSAFATVGLSTGITADLPPGAQLVLTVLMFVGRVGPVTMVSALALRDRAHLHRLPEGRPIIG